ncbi:MAG: rubrerythrin [Bdellovibrio sp.]|nr:rubrerythrin [Bdellovibrio sp.]
MLKKKQFGSQTYNLLKQAFAAECYAEKRFQIFAKIALDEGLPDVATAFYGLARSQNLHAEVHFDLLESSGELFYGLKTGNTLENIETALSGEILKSDEYTALITTARDEGLMNVVESMEKIAMTELSHIHRLDSLEKEFI